MHGRSLGWTLAVLASLASPLAAQSFDSGTTGADGPLRFVGIGTMSRARGYHTSTLLPNGKLLIAGSENPTTNTADLYDPATGLFTPTGAMTAPRAYHTSTLLPSGKVLITGGWNGGTGLSSAELYDSTNGLFTATGTMGVARCAHTATLLPTGKVLIAGGSDCQGRPRATTELYDPGTGTFVSTGSLASARYWATATLLADGSVLVAGGHGGPTMLNTAEVYDAASGVFRTTGAMRDVRHVHTSTRLPDGKVLIAGGHDGSRFINSAELYDPSLGTFAPVASMGANRGYHTATALTNGTVLVAGGQGPGCRADAETYDPATNQFTFAGGGLRVARHVHSATRLNDGRVLLTGGHNCSAYLSDADDYDPLTRLFSTRIFNPKAYDPPLDRDGDNVYHFTNITIPSGITVVLSSEHISGPVHWLASGDARIDGTLDASAQTSGHANTKTTASRVPSVPGPGGFPGGLGGNHAGGSLGAAQGGLGPGGGSVGREHAPDAVGGKFTGNKYLVPLQGGSGGGGGSVTNFEWWGPGGGAGGGAILISSSSAIRVNGAVWARGSVGGSLSWNCHWPGGSGSGGAIRLVAPRIEGSGVLSVTGGATNSCSGRGGPAGESGRVRLDAFQQNWSFSIEGNYSSGSPLSSFLPTGPPSAVRVRSIAGIEVPANPSGTFELPDVTINTSNSVSVVVEARGVPPGTVVNLHLFSLEQADVILATPPLAGTLESSSTTVQVAFPPGFTRGFARAVWR